MSVLAGGPLAQNGDGRLEVFARGDDNALWHVWQTAPNNGWSGWASLGGNMPAVPVVFPNADLRLEVFVRGDDNALWHIWQTAPNNGWSGWASLGGKFPGQPAVWVNADGRLEVFVRGDDNALWHIWQTAPGSAWSGWASLGGGLPGDPVVFRNQDGRVEVFVRGEDSALWHIWQTAPNNGWSGWASLGGGLPADPAAFRNADGRIEVFVRGEDNALWHIWQTAPNSGWSGWASLGGNFPGQPAVRANADGRLEVFVRGDDNSLWHIWQTAPGNGWSGWASLGGGLPGDPVVFQNQDACLEVFVQGEDSALWHIWQTAPNNGWSGWASLGGSIPALTGQQPAAASTAAPSAPPAAPASAPPATAPSNTSTAFAAEQAIAAQQGYYDPGCVVTYQGAQYTVMGASIGYTNNVPHVNGEDLQPVGGGAIVNLVPFSALSLVSPPTAFATAFDQEQAKAAQQGYFDAGCVVAYQGAQYTVMGVSIGYTNNVPHVNGEDLQPVGGGAIVNLAPYSALTLLKPPLPAPSSNPSEPATPPSPPPPPPPPPPPNQNRADPGHVFGIDQNSIQSPYGQFWLEAPGIFVLQDAAGNHKWESPYNGAPANGGCSGEMQTDGNLVAYAYYIYGGGAGTAKNPTWASGTQNNPGAYLLIDWQTYTAKVMSPDGTTVLWHS